MEKRKIRVNLDETEDGFKLDVTGIGLNDFMKYGCFGSCCCGVQAAADCCPTKEKSGK